MKRRQFLRRSALFTLAAALPRLAAADGRLASSYILEYAALKNGKHYDIRLDMEQGERLDYQPLGLVQLLVKPIVPARGGLYTLTRIGKATQKGDMFSAAFEAALQKGEDLLQGILPPRFDVQMKSDRTYVLIELEKGEYTHLSLAGCFLTTACTEARHLPDDCHELTVLRAWRDGHLRASAPGSALVDEYYRIAPRIVQQVNARANHAAIWNLVYSDLVLPVVALIETGKKPAAVQHYTEYVRWMQEAFTPEAA